MANIIAFDHVNNMLGDVSGVVTDALQRAQRPHDAHDPGYAFRVFDHIGNHFPQSGTVLKIHGLVVLGNPQRQVRGSCLTKQSIA